MKKIQIKFKPAYLFRGLFLAVLALLVYQAFSYWPAVMASVGAMQSRELPVYSVQTDKKQVALSFDAAWGNEDTGKILEILEKYNVKATFFMTGEWMDKYPEDVKKIAAAGHDLANHSANHLDMASLSAAEIKSELETPHQTIKELTGTEMTLFRPPYGSYSDTLVKTVAKCGYYCVQWDVDSLDWKDYGVGSIIRTVCQHKNLGNGSIVLMHNGAKYTAEALEGVITGLQEQGYELVPVSRLIYTGEYTIDHTGRQIPEREE